jgi:hypothetical protein
MDTLSSSARNPNDTQIPYTARFSPQPDSRKSWSEKSWTKQANLERKYFLKVGLKKKKIGHAGDW